MSPFNALAADVDKNGDIGISDVSALIDLILTGGTASMQWNALPTQGGIKLDNPAGETLEVYDLDANLVATLSTSTSIQVPIGTYLVTSTTRSRKVTVK